MFYKIFAVVITSNKGDACVQTDFSAAYFYIPDKVYVGYNKKLHWMQQSYQKQFTNIGKGIISSFQSAKDRYRREFGIKFIHICTL